MHGRDIKSSFFGYLLICMYVYIANYCEVGVHFANYVSARSDFLPRKVSREQYLRMNNGWFQVLLIVSLAVYVYLSMSRYQLQTTSARTFHNYFGVN